MLIQTDGGFFDKDYCYIASLDFRSFSSFSNSVFSLAFMEGLLHLLSIIFQSAFTNSYRNNVLYNFIHEQRVREKTGVAYNRGGTPSIMATRTKS